MPTEIRISKHNALYQASIQLEELDYTKLYRAYSGIRKSQIEPRVLFKVLVCAYMKGVYSSRKIEELCRENLVFRWLLEDQKTPDHCTIARFRGNRNLQEAFEDLFFQYVKKLENKGYTEHSEVFVDGTKIESKANRYTFVWLKQVSKQLEKIKARLKERVCPQGNLTSTFENLENRLLWKTIVIQKGLIELSAFWKLGGLWRAFLCFWRHLTVKRLLHLDFFLVQQPLFLCMRFLIGVGRKR